MSSPEPLTCIPLLCLAYLKVADQLLMDASIQSILHVSMSTCVLLVVQMLPMVQMVDGNRWRLEGKKDRNTSPLLILKKGKAQKLQLSSAVPGSLQLMLDLMQELAEHKVQEEELKERKALFMAVLASVSIEPPLQRVHSWTSCRVCLSCIHAQACASSSLISVRELGESLQRADLNRTSAQTLDTS